MEACTVDDMDLIELFISKGVSNWDPAMEKAALRGHMHLVDFFKEKLKE